MGGLAGSKDDLLIVYSLGLGKIGFHLAVFFPVHLSSGISLVENIDSFFPRLRAILLVRPVAIAPTFDARK